MTDLRLQTPFTCIIASPSKSGKSTFVTKLLKNAKHMFSEPPSAIYYFYNTWSPSFRELKQSGIVKEFIKGMCSREWLDEVCASTQNVTIVLDDQALSMTKEIAELFSVQSHQYSVNCILIAQNLFTKNKFFRDASLNASYIILGKNPRDESSVRFLAQQMLPHKSKMLVDAYFMATRKPYSFLLLDFCQKTPDLFRWRANIFSDDDIPMSIYIKK